MVGKTCLYNSYEKFKKPKIVAEFPSQLYHPIALFGECEMVVLEVETIKRKRWYYKEYSFLGKRKEKIF